MTLMTLIVVLVRFSFVSISFGTELESAANLVSANFVTTVKYSTAKSQWIVWEMVASKILVNLKNLPTTPVSLSTFLVRRIYTNSFNIPSVIKAQINFTKVGFVWDR